LREIAGDGFGRREPQPAHVGHGPLAAVNGDIVAERRIADEGQVAIADRYGPAGPLAEWLAGPTGDGDARLIVSFDVANDLAAVGDVADCGARPGAVPFCDIPNWGRRSFAASGPVEEQNGVNLRPLTSLPKTAYGTLRSRLALPSGKTVQR
jgi:hypothetical protein